MMPRARSEFLTTSPRAARSGSRAGCPRAPDEGSRARKRSVSLCWTRTELCTGIHHASRSGRSTTTPPTMSEAAAGAQLSPFCFAVDGACRILSAFCSIHSAISLNRRSRALNSRISFGASVFTLRLPYSRALARYCLELKMSSPGGDCQRLKTRCCLSA
jgi:hypothetical protein